MKLPLIDEIRRLKWVTQEENVSILWSAVPKNIWSPWLQQGESNYWILLSGSMVKFHDEKIANMSRLDGSLAAFTI